MKKKDKGESCSGSRTSPRLINRSHEREKGNMQKMLFYGRSAGRSVSCLSGFFGSPLAKSTLPLFLFSGKSMKWEIKV